MKAQQLFVCFGGIKTEVKWHRRNVSIMVDQWLNPACGEMKRCMRESEGESNRWRERERWRENGGEGGEPDSESRKERVEGIERGLREKKIVDKGEMESQRGGGRGIFIVLRLGESNRER